jgi:hypothetical protein
MADMETSDQGSRTMPDFVKKGLIKVQGGMLYLKAPYRVLWMREEHSDWSIVTSIEYADWDKGFAVVRAVIMDGEGRMLATAHAEESRGKLPFVRKAETAAIARALSLCGYGTIFGEINEEEFDGGTTADPMAASPRGANGRGNLGDGDPGMKAGTDNAGPGQCPSCHAPAGKKHTPNCKG